MSPSRVALTERSWISRFWATAATPAVRQLGQADQQQLDRSGALVLGGEQLRVVPVEHELVAVALLLTRGRRSPRRCCGCGSR